MYHNLLLRAGPVTKFPRSCYASPVGRRLRILNVLNALEAWEGSSERERGQRPPAYNQSLNVT